MLYRYAPLGLILFILTLSTGISQESVGQTLGPKYNTYNADHLPENDPAIAKLVADMSVEEAIVILQHELFGAQFIGLDGVKAEHWGSSDNTPETAVIQTLSVNQQELSWRSMMQDEGEIFARFLFEDALQVWTRFSMAE